MASALDVAVRTEHLTLLPMDSLAWVKNIISPSIPRPIGLRLTINLPPPHPRSNYENAVSITFRRFSVVLTEHPLKASQP